jgi:hypothetical protein
MAHEPDGIMAKRIPAKGNKVTKPGTNGRAKGKTTAKPPKAYTSSAWERVYVLAVKLDAFAKDLRLPDRGPDAEGFDLTDAARELTRLALNHNREANPDGRTQAQEKDDWVSVVGVGADLGNMADEGSVGQATEGVRAVAHELCFLACDFLF